MPLSRAIIPEPAFVESIPYVNEGAATWPTANTAIGVLLPKRATPVTIVNLGVLMFTASGNIDLGLYTYSGGTFTRITAKGSTAASGSNAMQYLALASSYVYNGRDDIWVWCAADNTTVSLGRVVSAANVTTLGNRVAAKATSFPLPSTIASTATSGTVPYVYGGA